jgi:hypothetical protein
MVKVPAQPIVPTLPSGIELASQLSPNLGSAETFHELLQVDNHLHTSYRKGSKK